MVKKIDANETVIKEFTKTAGHYKTKGFKFDATNDTTTSYDFSFPYDVEILAGEFNSVNSIQGDDIELVVAPDTITGVTTQAHVTSDTVINVSQTVADNAAMGYWLTLGSDEYVITAIDKVDKKVTISPGLTGNLAASSLVKQTIKMVETLYLEPSINIRLGWTKIGSSYIPAGTTLRMKYNNTDSTTKEIVFMLDVLY